MRIWIVKASEPLPINGSARLMRASALAETFAARGHDVTYWASTFHHREKRHLSVAEMPERWGSGVEMRYLDGPAYRRNVSVGRIKNHRAEARAFTAAAGKEPPPDVILSCMPTLDLAEASVVFGSRTGTPVLIDIRDMWPESFVLLAPQFARRAARIVLQPFYWQFAKLARGATGIVGISEGFLDYGLKYAGRARHSHDAVFRTSYQPSRLSAEHRDRAAAFWRARGIDGSKTPIACFIGTLSRRSTSDLLRAVRLFRESEALRNWKLVLCGGGELEADLRAAAGANVDVVGWTGPTEVGSLLEMASVGIIPYPNETDFLAACPNKFGEYANAGLPILSFLKGEVGELIRQNDCGWVYESDADFVAALEGVTRHPAAQASRSARARDLFDREFAAQQVYGGFADHVERVGAAFR